MSGVSPWRRTPKRWRFCVAGSQNPRCGSPALIPSLIGLATGCRRCQLSSAVAPVALAAWVMMNHAPLPAPGIASPSNLAREFTPPASGPRGSLLCTLPSLRSFRSPSGNCSTDRPHTRVLQALLADARAREEGHRLEMAGRPSVGEWRRTRQRAQRLEKQLAQMVRWSRRPVSACRDTRLCLRSTRRHVICHLSKREPALIECGCALCPL